MPDEPSSLADNLSTGMDAALTRLLAPVAQMEKLKRKEYLTQMR